MPSIFTLFLAFCVFLCSSRSPHVLAWCVHFSVEAECVGVRRASDSYLFKTHPWCHRTITGGGTIDGGIMAPVACVHTLAHKNCVTTCAWLSCIFVCAYCFVSVWTCGWVRVLCGYFVSVYSSARVSTNLCVCHVRALHPRHGAGGE